MPSLGTLVFLALVGIALSEVVNFKPCRNATPNCVVHEVRIDPCREASANQPCKLKRGKTAKLAFDFTPSFDAEKIEGRLYWANGDLDLPLAGMDPEACQYTTCPLVKNEKRTLDFNLPISKKFPSQTFQIKWRLTTDNPDNECCYQTDIKLVR